jgi:LGFP repeat
MKSTGGLSKSVGQACNGSSLSRILVILVACTIQAFGVIAAQGQDKVFINDRWPIRGPNGSRLSPPHITPTNECSDSVYVYSFVPKAKITVFLNGTIVIGGPVTSVFGFKLVKLTKRLHTGDKITAIQEVNGVVSSPTLPPMTTGKMPTTLPAPTIDPKIYACGLVVPVHNLAPGVDVEVWDETAAKSIGTGSTPNLWGSDWAPVSTSSLVVGHILTARQSACTGVKAEAVVKPPVLPEPTPLTAPNLDYPIAGNDAITAHGLFNGSVLKAFQSGTIGTGVSTAETNWMQVHPPVSDAPPAPGVTSNQALCTSSPPSSPLPTRGIPPPVLRAPICPGQRTVLVGNTTINATLVLLRNNAVSGYSGAAPGDVPIDIAPPAALSNGDNVQIAEYVGTRSVLSARAYVNCFKQNVLTQHNNNQRTGAQLAETKLTPINVKGPRFGLLYDRAVLGTIMAQPLYVHGVKTGTVSSRGQIFKNLVYVATSQDIVYAFDADDTSADTVSGGESTKWIWRTVIGTPHTGDICGETDPPVVGITSTPVIDISAKRMYVVARDQRQGPGLGVDVLHTLDIGTGADLKNVVVSATASVNNNTTVEFNPTCQRQRPGLLLQNGNVYLGYGTYTCDAGCPGGVPYRGWVIGYRASDLTPAGSFTNSLTPTEGGMGIWASGNGLVGNEDGSAIFYQTGNDIGGSGVLQNGDAFLKLTSTATSISFAVRFQPGNASDLRDGDTDLGSGGPMLLPGGKLVGGGKDGVFYLLPQADLTTGTTSFQAFFNTFHFGPASYPYNAPPVYTTNCPLDAPVGHVANKDQHCFIDPALYPKGESYGPNIHGGPVYWTTDANHGLVYKMAEKDYLKAFAYNALTGTLNPVPAKVAPVRPGHDGMPGGFSSISASGIKNGIVWTVVQQLDGQWGPASSAILYAFDAKTLDVLWNNAGVDEAAFAKFNSPTIADGRVFLPSVGHFQVYGLALAPIGRWRVPLRGLPLPDAIKQRWLFSGGPAGTLGIPVEKQTQIADDAGTEGMHSDFAQDVIGGGYGNISLPANALIVIPMCKDPETQKKIRIVSSIYASPKTGAHIVRGEIRRVFLAKGGVRRFGYPITDEVPTPDGFGLMTRFERGAFVWYPGKEVRIDNEY